MRSTKAEYIADWYEKCRQRIERFQDEYDDMSLAQRLTEIRGQYAVLAKIREAWAGDAFFIGVPTKVGQRHVKET